MGKIILMRKIQTIERREIKMKAATIQLETLTCPSCMLKIEGAINKLEGIDKDSVKVSFNTSKAKVNFDEEKLSLEQIEGAITKVGYNVIKSKEKSI